VRAESLLSIGQAEPGLRDAPMRLDLAGVPGIAARWGAGIRRPRRPRSQEDPKAPLVLAAASRESFQLTTAVVIALPCVFDL